MKPSLKHISHFIQDTFLNQEDRYPPLPLSLLSLPARQYKVFRHLVIPANGDIAIIDWALVRNDCVFVLAQLVEPEDTKQLISDIHYQYNQLKTIAGHLKHLLEQVHYDGAVFPILVSLNHVDLPNPHHQSIIHVNALQPYLMDFLPDRRVMKPGFAIQLLRQIEHAMRSRAYRNKLALHRLVNLQNYYWMKDFTPTPILSSMRDFAFRPAKRPQAIYINKKEK